VHLGAAAVLAVAGGLSMAGQWHRWILFRNRIDFGANEPQFHTDVGFYVFQPPFLEAAVDWLFMALVLTLVATAAVYYLNGAIRPQAPAERLAPPARRTCRSSSGCWPS
jgi:Uncharacterized conserved protein